MKHYIIVISWNDPYPKKFEFRVEASGMGTALARGFRQFRAENKGRKIKQIGITATQI